MILLAREKYDDDKLIIKRLFYIKKTKTKSYQSVCVGLCFNFMKQERCSLKDKKSKATEIWFIAPFLAGFIYFFDRMMPPHERRLSLAELSFQKLHLISPFSLWSILGSVEDLWKTDSAVSRNLLPLAGTMAEKHGCIFLVYMRIYCIYKKNADKI